MASEYLIQIIDKSTRKVVTHWEPGLQVEKQFVTELCDRIRAKGVGMFRSTDHVVADVRDAVIDLLYDLKSQV